jgi:hypothetical protein
MLQKNSSNAGISEKVQLGYNAKIQIAATIILCPFLASGFVSTPRVIKRERSFSESKSQTIVLLRLPHRQFVFTTPKALRPYFFHDRKLY